MVIDQERNESQELELKYDEEKGCLVADMKPIDEKAKGEEKISAPTATNTQLESHSSSSSTPASHNLPFELSGLIDFGDSQLGHPLYDIVCLHVSVFQCNKELLREFLRSYGLLSLLLDESRHVTDAPQQTPDELRKQFVYCMMCYTLLYTRDAFSTKNRGVFFAHPEWANVTDLHELAHLLWNIE